MQPRAGRPAAGAGHAARRRWRSPTARATPIEDTTEYVATLKSLQSTTVQPQIDGQITKILVVSGDRVAQGAPLMQIDPQRQQAAVSSQQAEFVAAASRPSATRGSSSSATSELYAAGAIAKQELEQAQTALETAEARLKALQAQVQQQEVQLRYFTVTAPTAGVVGDVPVRVGSQVTPQTLLTTIDQNATLEVNVSVPIERAPALRTGLPLQIWSSDGAQRIATTAVSFVSPHVDDQTQSVLVKAQVPNPGGDAAAPAVRPRADRLEDDRRPRGAGDRGAADQRAVLRVRRRDRRRRRADREAARDQGRRRSSATTTRCSTASSRASASSSPARRSSMDGAPIAPQALEPRAATARAWPSAISRQPSAVSHQPCS